MPAVTAPADASAKDVEVWTFERISYENYPVSSYESCCSGLQLKYAFFRDLENLCDATLATELEALCIDLSCYTHCQEEGEPSLENFEKLKILNVLEATLIRLDHIRGLPEMQVLICCGGTLDVNARLYHDTLVAAIASWPKLRCIVTYDYEFYPDVSFPLQVFPVSSLSSIALMRACYSDYSFLLSLPNLENLHLDLSNCMTHNVLDTLRRLPYKNKLLRFGMIDLELLRNVSADKLYSTAQELLDDWPNLRQLTVNLPDFGVTNLKTLRFPKAIRVLKLINCGPLKLQTLLSDYKELRFLAVFTDRVNSKDLRRLRHCVSTKTLYMGIYKVKLNENFSHKYKYHFKLSKSSAGDDSTSFFDFVHKNFDTTLNSGGSVPKEALN